MNLISSRIYMVKLYIGKSAISSKFSYKTAIVVKPLRLYFIFRRECCKE